MYEVRLFDKAQEFYLRAPIAILKKINKCLTILEQTPYNHANIIPLKGKLAGRYRFRIGDYRVVYLIDEELKVVFVTVIDHRSAVYDH